VINRFWAVQSSYCPIVADGSRVVDDPDL